MFNRRSYLFVPASSGKMVEKAIRSEADSVIIDLEDAVALTEKKRAREVIKSSVDNLEYNKQIFVRINNLNTPFWEEDVVCAIRIKADGIMLPKAECAQDIERLCEKIQQEIESDTNPGFRIIPLIETAKGIQQAYEIASSSNFIDRLAFGSIDYSLDIDCQLSPEGFELLFARSQIVNASRAAGIHSPIDAVYPDLNDDDGLIKEASFARQLGFKGKMIIHPKQIESVHKLFSPSKAEMIYCQEVVEKFEEAEKQGIASIRYKNKLIDYPVYLKAKQVLDKLG
ncbi:CoA ester lyase [Halobacillus sp. Marseille-P3879]|uniref:HpcH/HpaI aldolase/citrate lyase family protein n=1 Tax=Halobacillus sp. Marseille-P3879 TaxID=2045014 RepID=UPI000C7D88AD|nr:CoA ester lyase [Halobacillus sp. Marseille-P3879]